MHPGLSCRRCAQSVAALTEASNEYLAQYLCDVESVTWHHCHINLLRKAESHPRTQGFTVTCTPGRWHVLHTCHRLGTYYSR